MAKKKVATRAPRQVQDVNGIPPIPEIPKGETLVLEKTIVPIVGVFGRSVEVTYKKEFNIVNNMDVGRSVAFHKNKKNVIDAIRTRLQKISPKRFVMKKADDNFYRMWRVEDGTKIARGGRVKGVSPYKKAKVAEEQLQTENQS